MESHVSEPGGLGDSGIEMYKLGSHLHTDILHSLAGRRLKKNSPVLRIGTTEDTLCVGLLAIFCCQFQIILECVRPVPFSRLALTEASIASQL